MEALFDKIFDIFSLEYIFSVIIASYFMIKIVDVINGKSVVPSWLKRAITFLIGAILFIIFREYTDVSVQSLIASFFSALFIYDAAIKTLIKKFNIDYRK